MDHMGFHRLRGNLTVVSAALGVGALITMGALTVALPSTAVGTSPNRWTADANVTLVPEIRARPSFRPQYIVDPCDWATDHMRMHHNR